MSAWEELLAVTRPGTEMKMPTGESWIVMSRAYRQDDQALPWEHLDRLTVTVELIRAGSASDPRPLPPDAPGGPQ